MSQWNIQVTFQDSVYVAEVLNRGDEPFYAQGKSYEEALSNLFGVIQEIRDINEELKAVPQEPLSFSVPALA